jgi:hypothetical protein
MLMLIIIIIITWVGKILRAGRCTANTNFCQNIRGVEATSEKQLYIHFDFEMDFKERDFLFLKNGWFKIQLGT